MCGTLCSARVMQEICVGYMLWSHKQLQASEQQSMTSTGRSIVDEAPQSFDSVLSALLVDARESSMEDAVDVWLPRLDETFIPSLGELIRESSEPDDVSELSTLMEYLERRSMEGFERAKAQLDELLKSGEINKMDAALCKLVKKSLQPISLGRERALMLI